MAALAVLPTEASTHDPTTLKFPHTRAQLAAVARQYKPADTHESDTDQDDLGRVPASLLTRVVSLLADEKEDELKALLKDTYGLDNQSVSITT